MNITPFAFDSDPGYGLPPALMENQYVQETPAGPVGFSLLPRPGLTAADEVGSGPTRGMFSRSGVFNGDLFTVSGGALYRNTTLVGAISGTGPAVMDASANQLVIVGGTNAYVYDGALTQITDPDLPTDVSGVAYLAGRFVFTETDTDQFAWSAINDAFTIDGLDFATAEDAPDPNLGVIAFDGRLGFPGSDTFQFWFVSPDGDAPFQPIQRGSYAQTGCAAMGTVVPIDNGLVFVGNDRKVYMVGNAPVRISEAGIEEALANSTAIEDCTAMRVPWRGHEFYVLNVPGEGTFAWDASISGKTASAWAKWSSFGRDVFRCNYAVSQEGVVTLGDDTTGEQFTLSTDYNDGDLLITRIASAFIPIGSGVETIGPIILRGAVGVGTDIGPDPTVQMRLSRDRGRTFTDWRDGSLGTAPNYVTPPKWHRNGRAFAPGLLLEFRCTEALLTAWWGVTVNEPV
jgi:hypothetical protein